MKQTSSPNPSTLKHILIVDSLIFTVLIIITLIGIGLTDVEGIHSKSYWSFIFIGMAVGTTLWSSWRYTKLGLYEESQILYRQLILWGAGIVGLATLYLLLSTGRLNYETTGFLILLLLALVTFIDAMLVSWKLYLVGLLFLAILLLSMYVESYLWIIVIIALALVLLVGTYVFFKLKHLKHQEKA
ncbi:MAG: Unknown protein [uncultured Sulfurovum sp.]|uniref:DUF2157 domain-containing protein n=1 Tax=uncultured Sulfurovum sp. TaxID=269237 RepID=A0A6S6TNF7_9BACT|nr:MAG: Unknown protein [uncultured Sulfurovum sp.]